LVVIHGLFSLPFVEGARAAKRHKIPCIVQPHGSLDPRDLVKHHNLKRLYGPLVVRPILRDAQKVLVTTRREADRLVGYGAQPAIDVVPLPVPPPHAAPDGRRFRARFGIPSDAPVVLFLSRLDPKKGLERLLPAVASLAAARPNVRVVIAGGTEDRTYWEGLRHQASALHLDGVVTWAGMLLGEDKWDAFAGSDLFVLPSSFENFGIVVVEALLTGTPVVISDEVYVGDDLTGSPAVYVTDSGASSVAAALDRALQDVTADGPRLSEAARKAVAAFSPEVVTQRTIAVYETALASSLR
jgi:glycosyltransferase involved in cell wall biosynthesis